jgi:hypothetical protein
MALRCFSVMKSFNDLFLTVFIAILRQSACTRRYMNRIEFGGNRLKLGRKTPVATIGLLRAANSEMSFRSLVWV